MMFILIVYDAGVIMSFFKTFILYDAGVIMSFFKTFIREWKFL